MQPNRRFVQNVQRSYQARSQRRRQLNALRLAPRQSRRQSIERKVFQSHFVQKPQPLADFFEQALGNLGFLGTQLHCGEKCCRVFDRHTANFTNIFAVDLDLPRFQPQPRASALRTSRIAAIAAQKHADMQLVFLPLEVLKKSPHAEKLAVAVENEFLLRLVEIGPWHIQRNLRLLGEAFHIGEKSPIFRLGPRIDGALAQRFQRIRNDEPEIEVDGIAKSLAPGARAVGIVK